MVLAGCFCHSQSQPRARPPSLGQLLRAIDCLTRRDLPVGLDPKFSDPRSYRIRYSYRLHNPKVRIGNQLHLMVYGKDGRSALLYEILIEAQAARENFVITTVASLEKRANRWVVTQTLGGGYSYRDVQALADAIAKTPKRVIPRSAVTRSGAGCTFR